MRPVSFSPGSRMFRLVRRWLLGRGCLLLLAAASRAASINITTSHPDEPVVSPTQSVPAGVRPLRGPPLGQSSGAFEVEAADYASVQAVIGLAQHLKVLMSKDLPWPDFPPGAIRIQLIPAAQAGFPGPYLVNTDSDGQHTALIRWGPDTALSDVCLALARVTVESVAASHNAASPAPEWLKLAYGKLLEAETKPAIVDEFAANARRQPILSLRQIMTAENPALEDVPLLALNAYWLARFFEDESHANSTSAIPLFGPLVSGADPVAALTTAFPGKFGDPRELELWWQVNCRDLTQHHLSLVLSMAQSRALLDRLEFVDLSLANNATQHTRLDDAWPSRSDKSLQQQLATIMLNAAPLPIQINPVYKNALLSLLRALTQMSQDDEKAFRAAWAQYLADRTDAEAVEAGVEKAMSTP